MLELLSLSGAQRAPLGTKPAASALPGALLALLEVGTQQRGVSCLWLCPPFLWELLAVTGPIDLLALLPAPGYRASWSEVLSPLPSDTGTRSAGFRGQEEQ